MANTKISMICPRCNGNGLSGLPQSPCPHCGGDGKLIIGELDIDLQDILDKCNDIFEKLNE